MKYLPKHLGRLFYRYKHILIPVMAVAIILISLSAYYRLFLYQTSLKFSYAEKNCIFDPTVLPDLFEGDDSESYSAEKSASFQAFGLDLFSTRTCIHMHNNPQVGVGEVLKLGLFGNNKLAKTYRIETTNYPAVLSLQQLETKAHPIKKPLEVELDKQDIVFSYRMKLNDRFAQCTSADSSIYCHLQDLGAGQGQTHMVTLERLLRDQLVETIGTVGIKLDDPIMLVSSSVNPGSVIYDRPKSFNLHMSKNLDLVETNLDKIKEDGTREPIEAELKFQDDKIEIVLANELERGTAFEISLKNALSQSGSTLESPLTIGFSTSLGPKVVGAGFGNHSIPQSGVLAVKFDQELKEGTFNGGKVKLLVDGQEVPASVSVSGATLSVKPSSPMQFCGKIKLSISGDIASVYDISASVGWSHDARIICHRILTIGHSVRGKPIQAYWFGAGSSKILYLGGTHGNEKSTKYLLESWVGDLKVNPDSIPGHRSIIVIPDLNPDGFASSSRLNANRVDLNRNFPINNWKQNVTIPGGQYIVSGGGASPLSEPESNVIASFVQTHRPRLVLTYHSAAALVSPNGSGDSVGLTDTYSSLSGYRVLSYGQNDTVFHYDTTGAFEDWLHEKLSMPAILVELGSSSNSQWSKNKKAMWHMAQIP